MKLAEALALRKDAQTRLEQLRTRAVDCARYQEGEPPSEDSAALLAEAERVADEIESLVRRVNRTNSRTELETGLTITDAIARRDALKSKHQLVTAVANAAGKKEAWGGRQMRSELRELTDLDVPELRRRADEIAVAYRELDTRLQAANWSTDLLD